MTLTGELVRKIAYYALGFLASLILLEAALQIGLLEFLAKLLLYYLHERVWTRIRL